MELDVCLTRSRDEPWGFRLIGGVDFNMPLTVVKVVPSSPAEAAGLRNGDSVASIDGVDASGMAHEDSKTALVGAGESLRLGIVRGLYDPVIDDFDPIYEPIDQEDFDQRSQPTEVPDYLDLTLTLPEYANTTPYGDQANNFKPLPDLIGQKDSRSLTASPFVVPTKPYRPFSTEPVPEVPPLEDPIILNSNFHDEFGNLKDLEEFLPKTRFKLPISAQYDPDGTKQKMKLDGLTAKDVTVKDSMTIATETKTIKEETMVKKDLEMKDQAMTKQEVKFSEKMKNQIDLENIEKTATFIVDESIEKALTVAKEIKKEIDIELSESSDSETSKMKSVKKSSAVMKSSKAISALQEESSKSEFKETVVKEVRELVDLIDKTTEETLKLNERKSEKKVSHVSEAESIIDSKQSEQKESKSEKHISDEVESKLSIKKEDIIRESQEVQRKVSKQETKSETVKDIRDTAQTQATTRDLKETKYSTSKLVAEQRSYVLGLQTIPNIRATAHSSYHYDLLLKTFFVHLTDVMVALSRFILAEQVLSKPLEQETKTEVSERREAREDKTKETVSVERKKEDIKIIERDTETKVAVKEKASETADTTKKDEMVTRVLTPVKKERVVGKILQKAQEIKHQDKQHTTDVDQKKVIHEQTYQTEIKHVDEHLRTEEIVKKRELSGSRMAQLVEKKPEELMQNMENVLTEFESKSSNEDIETVRERRSRSRSAVVTPVEMMQLDRSSQEIAEHTAMATSAMSSCMTESKTSRMSESGYETADYETIDGAKTYIAIVQSHVYTNKDAIFEATAQQSTEEMVTKEVIEAVSAEKVSVKSLDTSEKAVQAVVDTSSKLVSAKKEEVVEKIEPKPKEIMQKVQKVEEKVIQKEQKYVEDKEVVHKMQKVEEKVTLKDQKTTEKVEGVMIQEITEPIVEEFKSTFTQNYTVTEAKEEIDTSKSEFVSKYDKVTIVEETADIKEETVFFKDESISIAKEEEMSVKEESVALKDSVIAHKQEIIFKDVKEEPIVVQEVTALEAVKEESIIVKEEVAAVKEEPVVVKEKVQEEILEVKEDKKEEIFTFSLAKQEVSVKDSLEGSVSTKQDTIAVKEVTVKEKDESVALKISKEQIIEQEKTFVEVDQDVSFKKLEINEFKSHSQFEHIESKQFEQESTFVAKSINQESTFVGKSVDTKEKLSLDLVQKKVESIIADNGDLIKTPTPSTVPPTPVTDEYVFTLTTKLPKREGTPIPRDCTPSDEDEDPHIVKKSLVPHIDAKVEDQKIFDPPLPTPPQSPTSPKSLGLKGGAPVNLRTSRMPVYFKPGLRGGAPLFPLFPVSPKTPAYIKPGLRGGADREYNQEEIKEIERKSSLLASAIDETIKSIEEYKEEVGIKKQITIEPSTELKTAETVENGVMYNGYAKVVETKVFDNAILEKSTTKESKNMEEVVEYTNGVEENNITDEEQKQVLNISEKIIEITEPKIESQSESTQVIDSPTITTVKPTEIQSETSPEENKCAVTDNAEIYANDHALPEEKKDAVNENAVVNAEEMSVPDIKKYVVVEEKRDPMEGYRPVPFDPEELNALRAKRAALGIRVPYLTPSQERELYKTASGEIIGTHQGIVDGLEEAMVDPDAAKELGKPGITEDKIAELISGEAEMLREAHVMGLSRVIASHMHRDGDDSSVDFNKIKPIVESLKDSEVLKALNEELLKDAQERKKKEAKKESWTTFLQKPKRPVPRSKFGYYKEPEEAIVESYKPKIVKQPKPKVAPDYKPKDFNTGLLPWEERALREPTPPPVDPEDPILIPEEAPLILEAVDPLPESEVPDLEDTGIPLPPPPEPKEASPPPEETEEEQEELDLDAVLEETEKIVEENLVEEMENRNIAEQIMASVQNMVDPNAPLEQQLAQMRAQLAALAQLPGVIQQSLELVTRQLTMLGQVETTQKASIQEMPEADMTPAAVEETEVSEHGTTIEETQPQIEELVEQPAPTLTPEEVERMRWEEEQMLEEQRRMEKQKKELMEQARIEHESRQIKQRPTPRVGNPLPDPRVGTPTPRGKPKPVFGPAAPFERPVVILPGGRKWKTPKDAYNDAFIAETLQGQAELINGKTMGVNFMKYEKPPVSLDHLKESDVYKMIHNMEMTQPKRVEMLTPVIAEADYREKCRSMTPCPQRLAQQMQP